MCCDYRRLNDITVPDSSPIPTFEEVRDSLQGGKIFSKIDLRSGYWQMWLSDDSQLKTAFSPGPQFGLWHWTVLPFGLRNAPSAFQREIKKVFHDLEFVSSYMDDLFIHSQNKEDHIQHLRQFFQRCEEFNLTLNAKKCQFAVPEIVVLGHIIGNNSVRMAPEKLETITNWPRPENKKQLQSFLGLCNYSSRFVRNYALFTAPLYELTRKGVPFIWTDDLEMSFQTLKDCFKDDMCLTLPDVSQRFQVYTDASNIAVSGVLMQNGYPVEFCSRILNQSEQRYSTVQKECLAILFTLKKFRHYLLGVSFDIFTDHKPLIWLHEQRLDGMLGRWALAIQEFDFKMNHISGKDNILADAVTRQLVNAIEAESYFSNEDLLEAQRNDLVLSQVHDSLLAGEHSPRLPDSISPWLKKRWKQLYQQLALNNEVIYRRYKLTPTEPLQQVPIIPDELQDEVMRLSHDPPQCGHLGVEKTLARILRIAYWPGIRKSVVDFVAKCKSCQEVKAVATRPPLQQMVSAATAPGELVTADILKLPPDSGFSAILLLIDAYSKFPVAYKLRNELASTLSSHFIHYFSVFGIPQKILTDQGTNFESKLVHDIFDYFGIKKLRTTPYHPQTDGETERMNRSILEMLRHYSRHGRWVEHLDLVLLAYRSAVNSSTGKSPALLFLGREINGVPVFPKPSERECLLSESEYADILDDVDLKKALHPHSSLPDTFPEFHPGDFVLVRRHVRSKLQPIFDADWKVTAAYEGCVSVEKNNVHRTVNVHDVVLQRGGRSVVNVDRSIF